MLAKSRFSISTETLYLVSNLSFKTKRESFLLATIIIEKPSLANLYARLSPIPLLAPVIKTFLKKYHLYIIITLFIKILKGFW